MTNAQVQTNKPTANTTIRVVLPDQIKSKLEESISADLKVCTDSPFATISNIRNVIDNGAAEGISVPVYLIGDDDKEVYNVWIQHHSNPSVYGKQTFPQEAYDADAVICCYPSLIEDIAIKEKTLFNKHPLEIQITYTPFMGMLSVKPYHVGYIKMHQAEEVKNYFLSL